MPKAAKPRRRRSLKATLLWWLVPALLIIMAGALWMSNRLLKEQVDAAYDRSLAGALRAIDLNVSTASGGLAMEQPYLMLEFFELTANGRVYFRVASEDGLAEIGYPRLPLPPGPLVSGQAQFFYSTYHDEPVRVAVLARETNPPLGDVPGSRIIVQVAESLESRQVFTQSVLLRSLERDIAGIAISILLLVAAIVISLRPLARLRDEMQTRAPDDLSPIDDTELPSEVLPLVAAVNQHMQRYEAQSRAQQQFLDDASHQLRTPLSVLRTQLVYALRETDPAELRAALTAMHEGLDRAARMTNQMLALARARDATLAHAHLLGERVELVALADSVVRSLLPAARIRQLDYGLDCAVPAVQVAGSEWMLREALVNLVDNAIRYSPVRGRLTVSVKVESGRAICLIEDEGPGMSPADIERAGVRFRRGQAGKHLPGAGLGLAIVKTIADLHGATLVLRPGTGSGLCAGLIFPLPGAVATDK